MTGSTTCPATASSMPDLNGLEERYGDHVQFVLLQVWAWRTRSQLPIGLKTQMTTED